MILTNVREKKRINQKYWLTLADILQDCVKSLKNHSLSVGLRQGIIVIFIDGVGAF